MTIGERIKEVRRKLGMSQVAFADKINVSKQTLYKYENNIITNIPSDKIEAVAKLGKITPAYIMGWEQVADEEIGDVFYRDMQQHAIEQLRSVFSQSEVAHFESYIQLNKQNMKLVDNYTEKLLSLQQMEDAVYVKAAHKRTDVEYSAEEEQADYDMMSDENF